MRFILMLVGIDSKIQGPFWKVVKFAVGVCNLVNGLL